MKAYLFPGQGSQEVGMGGELFDEFSELTLTADKILNYSIKELCLEDPDLKLNQTQYTQPALYVVNALSYQKKIKEGSPLPDFVAGHSLGEYNALQAAGVISFEDGLKLVKKRGELMSKAKNGGMAAIINSSEEQITQILQDANLTTIDIANLNSPTQIVISGLKDDINKSQQFFEKAGAMFIPLKTSGAFHSRYMKDAEQEYKKTIKKVKVSKPEIPVIANVTGKPHDFKNIKEVLLQQMSGCVKWSDSIMYLLSQGEIVLEEVGIGNVLTKLTNAIIKGRGVEVKKTEFQNEQKQAQGELGAKRTDWYSDQQILEISAINLVETWNKKFPVGTKVKSKLYNDSYLQTRTKATLLFGHRAAIYLEGYNGYFDLKELKPAI